MRPWAASTSLISFRDLRPRFGVLRSSFFRALDQIADVVDVLGLEAVGGTNRELEIVDRTEQDRIERRRNVFVFLGRSSVGAGVLMDRAEHGELILEDADGFTKGVFGTDGAVGLDRHLELVEVGALGHAGGLNLIGNAEDRGRRRASMMMRPMAALE